MISFLLILCCLLAETVTNSSLRLLLHQKPICVVRFHLKPIDNREEWPIFYYEVSYQVFIQYGTSTLSLTYSPNARGEITMEYKHPRLNAWDY